MKPFRTLAIVSLHIAAGALVLAQNGTQPEFVHAQAQKHLTDVPPRNVIADGDTQSRVVAGNAQHDAINGRGWQQLENQSKTALLIGIDNGVVLARNESLVRLWKTHIESLDASSLSSALNPTDISKKIDLFYSDPGDIRIPVIGAYKYSILSTQGLTPANFFLDELRRVYRDGRSMPEEANAPSTEAPSDEEDDNTDEWTGFSPDNGFFAATRRIPDSVLIQRQDLDGSRVVIFRSKEQNALTSGQLVARHEFRGLLIDKIEWSPDSRFLLFTTMNSAGHTPTYVRTFVFCAADKTFRVVEAAISVISGEFRFEPPDVAVLSVQQSGKSAEITEEEIKFPLAKEMHRMALAK